jgi:hypothetical protein
MIRGTAFPISLLFLVALAMGSARGAGPASAGKFSLTTSAFSPGSDIPARYTCSGEDLSPQLTWTNAPAGTEEFVLIADDPDAPSGTFTHWVLYNVGSQETGLPQGLPAGDRLSSGELQGRNDFGKTGYRGPCPPPGRPHRYFFKLYALDRKTNLKPGAFRSELEAAIKGHVLDQAEVMGKFKR